ncbi:hypothetical protein ACS0TY_008154 [Phlomoides rotata]
MSRQVALCIYERRRRTAAASIIQKDARMFFSKRTYTHLCSTAILIQASIRGMVATMEAAKETGALQNQVEELTSKLQLEKHMRTAEEVSFAANGITTEGIKAVDGFLQSNIALKSLNLSGNSTRDEGVKSLCDILVDNSCIQKLQLSGSSLGDEGFSSLLEPFLRIRAYSKFTSTALAKGLEGNKSLREHLAPNIISHAWTATSHIITAVIGSGLLSKTYRSGDPVTGQRNYTYMDAVKPNLVRQTFWCSHWLHDCSLSQYVGLRPAMLLVAAAKLTEAETELRSSSTLF